MASTNISYLLEMCICLGFALQAAKCRRGLTALKYSASFAFVLGSVVVALEPLPAPTELGSYVCDFDELDAAFIALASICSLVSIASLAFVGFKARMSSNAVERRVMFRSMMYVVNSLVTVVPIVICIFVYISFVHGQTEAVHPLLTVFVNLATTLQDLNGAANAMTYFLQSRYARKALHDRAGSGDTSFHVDFSDEVLVAEISEV
jgi:hypothetical protein